MRAGGVQRHQNGYRLIDTARAYYNEEAVGKAVARAIADGLTTREDLFITTKVWVSDMGSEEEAYEAVKASLARLNMEYADLILLHQPMNDYFAAYRGITKAYKEGLTKAIGVANFYPAILANLCEAAGGDSGSQPGRTAPVLRAEQRSGEHESIRCRSTGMGPAGRRQSWHLYRSGAGSYRVKNTVKQRRRWF